MNKGLENVGWMDRDSIIDKFDTHFIIRRQQVCLIKDVSIKVESARLLFLSLEHSS